MSIASGPTRRRKALALACCGVLALSALLATRPGLCAWLRDVFAGLEPLRAAEMNELRGGFRTEFGLDLSFGAVVRTTLDGQRIYETRMTLTPDGWQVTPWTSTRGGAAAAARLAALEDRALAGFDGVVLEGRDGGLMAALHRLDGGQIGNVVINSSREHALRQDLEVTITARNFGGFQRTLRASASGAHAIGPLREATLGSLRR